MHTRNLAESRPASHDDWDLPTPDEALIDLENACVADARLRRLVTACRGAGQVAGAPLLPVGVPLTTGALVLALLARRPRGERTLETGFGYGVSACYFALGRRPGDDAPHHCFDPYLDWTGGTGRALLQNLDLGDAVRLDEVPSWDGLAALHRGLGAGRIGIALMDGSQLFDECMADFVVIDKLLADDGWLLIRDPYLPHAQALISFLRTNADYEVRLWSDQLAVARHVPGASRPWFRFEPFDVPFFGRVEPVDRIAQIPAPDGGTFAFADEPHHQYYLRRVLHGREYPALHPEVYLPTTILDIGAHVGSAARYFAHRYPDARIVCIEPTPESFALLERNTRHLPNVERFNVAFASEPGVLRIWRGKLTSGQNSAVPNEENGGDSFEATAVVPIQFCARHGLEDISIVKIDVEGLELQILRNLAPLLRRVDVFYVEYHSEALRRGVEELLGPGYSLFAAEAGEADRGTACYARSALIEQLRRATPEARYVFAKAGV